MSSTYFRSTPSSSLTYAELRSRFPSRFIVFRCLVEAGLAIFLSACFEFADEVSEEAQNGSLANVSKIFPSHLHGLSKVAAAGFCA